jgi:hypothetical protein
MIQHQGYYLPQTPPYTPCWVLNGSNPGNETTVTTGINDSGVVVSSFKKEKDTEAGVMHGYVDIVRRSSNDEVEPISQAILDVPGAKDTWLRGVNNKNQIVGYYYDGNVYHGFLWTPATTGPVITTIDFPGAKRTEVHGINDPDPITDQIEVVGTYILSDGTKHGFWAVSIPVIRAQ